MNGGTPMGRGRLTPIQNRLNGETSQKGSNWGSKMKSRRHTNAERSSSIGKGSDRGGSIPGTHERQAALNLILNKSK